jgi:hypothetical protein
MINSEFTPFRAGARDPPKIGPKGWAFLGAPSPGKAWIFLGPPSPGPPGVGPPSPGKAWIFLGRAAGLVPGPAGRGGGDHLGHPQGVYGQGVDTETP